MRDLALVLFLTVMLPLCLRFPMIGIGLWVWISVMNPHRMVYGFAYSQPWNQIIAGVALISLLANPGVFKFRGGPYFAMLCLFAFWITLTTFTVAVSSTAVVQWDKAIKNLLITALVLMTANTPARIHALIWVIVVSLSVHSAFGGIRTIVTGGSSTITGPPNSTITDNNQFAVAILLSIPLMNYLLVNTKNLLFRLALPAQMLLTSACIVGTYSRGGLITLCAVLAALWARSKHRIVILIAVILVSGSVFSLLPERYINRVSTIKEAEEDSSFQGRLDAWAVGLNAANDHLLGTGFEGPQQRRIWDRYLPNTQNRAAHSIYFQVLGEHGWIGLAIYLGLMGTMWRAASALVKAARHKPEHKWAFDFGRMGQIAIVAFMLGGAALSLAYLDIIFIIGALLVCALNVVRGFHEAPAPFTRSIGTNRLAPALPNRSSSPAGALSRN